MAQIIAGMYEIQEEIGSGGGGVVYLGRHVRLDKKVVLKADKRTLKAGKETLRREVDMLKGLSHTYIPQVYDFVEEDGTVYTIMDFIEGESFDKILKREGKQNQKNTIKWACQLLEAVSYLHRQGEYGILHGDIKPANIMLKTDGDICLIDFNIALALREDGAVKVGFSRGYASPEHYGAEYIEGRTESVISINFSEQSKSIKGTLTEATEVDEDSAKLLHGVGICKAIQGKKKAILLDTRSDIYSLGATLYHLFSGVKPSQNALEVKQLDESICNSQVIKILKKAMAANPNDRYQTADEMFSAFLNLRKNDLRVSKRRKRVVGVAASLSILFLVGGGLMMTGLKRKENRQLALTNAAYSEEALKKGDITSALNYAMKSVSREGGIFDPAFQAESILALTKALGIYDLSDGFKEHKTIKLLNSPSKMEVSPNGRKFIIVSGNEGKVFDSETDEEITKISLYESALSDCLFLDDENIIYSGTNGIESFNLTKKSLNWKGEIGTRIVLSSNKERLAMIDESRKKLIVYNSMDGKLIKVIDFGDKEFSDDIGEFIGAENYIFAMNNDGKYISVSFLDGSLKIYDVDNIDHSFNVYDEKGRKYFGGGFSKNYFTVASHINGEYSLYSFDLMSPDMSFEDKSTNLISVKTDEENIYILKSGELTGINMETFEQKVLAKNTDLPVLKFSDYGNFLSTLIEDGSIRIFNRAGNLFQLYKGEKSNKLLKMGLDYILLGNEEESEVRILKNITHNDKNFVSYDVNDSHFEARVSEKENRLLLFDVDKFYIYDLNGEKIIEKEITDSEKVYNTSFARKDEGSFFEVRWLDGKVKKFSLKNGKIVEEITGEKPDKNLEEFFLTTKYKFINKINSKAVVIDRNTGKEIDKIDIDDHLAYVTEIAKGVVLEFVDDNGNRYGYLVDEKLNELAYLPNITDIYDNTVLFDYHNGYIRKEKFYDIEELIKMGNEKMK